MTMIKGLLLKLCLSAVQSGDGFGSSLEGRSRVMANTMNGGIMEANPRPMPRMR